MDRRTTQHPLHSFRFWFLVLSCVAATTAWRLGWLPGAASGDPEGSVAVEETDISDAAVTRFAADPRVDLDGAGSEALAAASPDSPYFGGEPPIEESFSATMEKRPDFSVHGVAASDASADFPVLVPADSPSSTAAATAPPQTPFGRAHLEFVPADSVPQRGATAEGYGPSRDVVTADSYNMNVVPDRSGVTGAGVIQQTAATEASPDAETAEFLRATTSFETQQSRDAAFWARVDQMIAAGQDVEAHRELSTMYWEQPERRDELMSRITQTARKIYFQPTPHYLDPYVVQAGDVLQDIARANGVSWQYLAKLNRVDPRQIRAGQQLKVLPGPFAAVVDLRRFELTVHSHGYFVARFPVGIGKDGSTPVGEFTVQEKLENPTYYGPDRVIAADDPENPLGEFWISLGDSYGIHGTIDETTIGKAQSRGCLRLRNQDIADLYDLLVPGSTVVIRR